jgi:hypothetical protein
MQKHSITFNGLAIIIYYKRNCKKNYKDAFHSNSLEGIGKLIVAHLKNALRNFARF